MMDTESRARLLRKRVAALQIPPETMAEAEKVVEAAGLKISGAADNLRKEWLNDLVASTDAAAFRHAARDPSSHFLDWLAERARTPYHVSYRAVDSAAQRLGPEVAARVAMVVWPQEIAWAQRLRLSENPVTATKAAMFLREAAGNPARLFGKIADLYGDAVTKSGYSDNPAQDLSPHDIRFSPEVPEFSPLFLLYAARSYSDVLLDMTRDRIEILAQRAARDENEERRRIEAEKAVGSIRRFPMRRIFSVISSSVTMGLSANKLYLAEIGFVGLLESGDIEADNGVATFVSMISSAETRQKLFAAAKTPDTTPEEIQWGIAHLERGWIDDLPESFRKRAMNLQPAMEAWQVEVVEERREAPYDPVSDFGFFMIERSS